MLGSKDSSTDVLLHLGSEGTALQSGSLSHSSGLQANSTAGRYAASRLRRVLLAGVECVCVYVCVRVCPHMCVGERLCEWARARIGVRVFALVGVCVCVCLAPVRVIELCHACSVPCRCAAAPLLVTHVLLLRPCRSHALGGSGQPAGRSSMDATVARNSMEGLARWVGACGCRAGACMSSLGAGIGVGVGVGCCAHGLTTGWQEEGPGLRVKVAVSFCACGTVQSGL